MSGSRKVSLLLLLASLFLATIGCPGEGPSDKTPEGAVQLFLDAMRSRNREVAFGLLAPTTRQELGRRARMATEQGGAETTAEEMLAVERFVLRWELGRMTAEVEGDQATVVVTGAEESQRAEVQTVREEGSWRVVLPLD